MLPSVESVLGLVDLKIVRKIFILSLFLVSTTSRPSPVLLISPEISPLLIGHACMIFGSFEAKFISPPLFCVFSTRPEVNTAGKLKEMVDGDTGRVNRHMQIGRRVCVDNVVCLQRNYSSV